MKIAIVDDSIDDIEMAKNAIASAFPVAGISTENIIYYTDSKKFIDEFKESDYDIIFMDIIMDIMDGISTAAQIRAVDKYVKLVFSTSCNDYACESYEVGADYYLLKPYENEKIIKMLQRINIQDHENNRYIILPEGNRIILRSILYTYYYNHVIDIHTKNTGIVQTRMRQMDLEALLMIQPYFIKCSKGSILNMYEADILTENEVIMSDGAKVQVSRRRMNDTEKLFSDLMFDKIRRELSF